MKKASEGVKAPPRQAFSVRQYKLDKAMQHTAKRAESQPVLISMVSNVKDFSFDRA